jgi:flagellar motility protein MotE (MotC chaperone)
MKKLLIGVKILILVLILIKVASVVGLVQKSGILAAASFSASQALAESSASSRTSGNVPPAARVESGQQMTETSDDGLSKERELATALLAKKNELDSRENTLRTEEQRLLVLRKEITDKIALLKSQEEKLTSVLEASKTSEVKKYKEMAKVYEATPAPKAGKMMEQLDIKTAAGITMNMKKDKAGAIWGYLSPQKAVEITKEITRVGGRQQTE